MGFTFLMMVYSFSSLSRKPPISLLKILSSSEREVLEEAMSERMEK